MASHKAANFACIFRPGSQHLVAIGCICVITEMDRKFRWGKEHFRWRKLQQH